MSAPEIPNLKSIFANRRGAPSRGRGRGRAHAGASSERAEEVRDTAVRSTDQDAAGSRVSCVELGYLDDPYAQLFATQASTRRLPLLNRGTYVRTSAIDLLVDRFLQTTPDAPKQIVSLGAGTDTRYFRLKDHYPNINLRYHEIDFATNTAAKLARVNTNKQLYTRAYPDSPPDVFKLDTRPTTHYSSSYNLHALDLRSLATASDDAPPPTLPNLDPSIPTLILSEMCLTYLQATTVSSILHTFLDTYIPAPTPISLVLYEPILPNDAFGRTMISNLASRNIHLPTLTAYPELEDQRQRLKGYGFIHGFKAADTRLIWREWVTGEEKERVAGLEMLDEMEELDLLLKHYCVAWGWRDGGDGVFTRAWAAVLEQEGA
ncbi:leucine carboxyl methyltransferase 1 [Amniculicola lignicola CBS 123094]|uniref:Leucine carboxyl methyltransferase 1 n=1 Tax=Amniculicola lignicola CBS 123094 TaxID=1392246 RepID=A0A6A5WVQ4_9PLEO|nr:leucine carboxyl methyltransferase 1 [Amniculicola lignicola CBS 123094]